MNISIVTPDMKLRPNCDSDRAWVWSVPLDFADETPKPELLAVRFANAESKFSYVHNLLVCLMLNFESYTFDLFVVLYRCN